MKTLIACEESQRVTMEMRRLGHEAYSCDVQEPSGGGEYKFLLEPLRDECYAIRPEYLKPIGLTSEHTYWLRETGWDEKTGEAKHVIVIKLGMQNVAAIAQNIDWGSDEKTVAQLGRICDKARAIQRERALYAGEGEEK